MPSENRHDNPGRLKTTKSPLLRLPSEIRNNIYRYLVLSPFRTVEVHKMWLNTIVCQDLLGNDQNFSITATILRASRQIHEEVSAILYGENRFIYYCDPNFIKNRDFLRGESVYRFPIEQLRLIRDIELEFDVSSDASTSRTICELLKQHVISPGCSFRSLGIRFHIVGEASEWVSVIQENEGKLLDTICAVDVQNELSIGVYYNSYSYEDFDPRMGLAALMESRASKVAEKKSWVVKECDRCSNKEKWIGSYDCNGHIRYILVPKTA